MRKSTAATLGGWILIVAVARFALAPLFGCEGRVSGTGAGQPATRGGGAAGTSATGGAAMAGGGAPGTVIPGGSGGSTGSSGGAVVTGGAGTGGSSAATGGAPGSGGRAIGGSNATGGAIAATTPDGGTLDGGARDQVADSDPFAAPAVCTSKAMWTGGTRGSPSMDPGMACVDCHRAMNEGPIFSIGGTVYPSAHEPDLCNGANGSNGARIVITGADGRTLTLTPDAVGNFSSTAAVALPYRAKVTFMGRERLMVLPQMSGDCNLCHTQFGAAVPPAVMAPGRVLLP